MQCFHTFRATTTCANVCCLRGLFKIFVCLNVCFMCLYDVCLLFLVCVVCWLCKCWCWIFVWCVCVLCLCVLFVQALFMLCDVNVVGWCERCGLTGFVPWIHLVSHKLYTVNLSPVVRRNRGLDKFMWNLALWQRGSNFVLAVRSCP